MSFDQNRYAKQFSKEVKQDPTKMLEISLLDIDTIMAKYMEESVVPELEKGDQKIKVPVIYGNAERWKTAQRDGYLKDKEGRIQLPLVMFKRNSIAKNDQMRFLKDYQITYPTVKLYSKKNAYDRFSALNKDYNRRYETYDVRIPDYVNLSYEVIVWTSFTEHNNKIVEQFNYSTGNYWGDKDGYKFRVMTDNFDTAQDIGAGTERIIKTTFTLMVYAYLLPKRTEQVPTTQKGFTTRKVLFNTEVVVNINDSKDDTKDSLQQKIDRFSPSIVRQDTIEKEDPKPFGPSLITEDGDPLFTED